MKLIFWILMGIIVVASYLTMVNFATKKMPQFPMATLGPGIAGVVAGIVIVRVICYILRLAGFSEVLGI